MRVDDGQKNPNLVKEIGVSQIDAVAPHPPARVCPGTGYRSVSWLFPPVAVFLWSFHNSTVTFLAISFLP